MSDQSSHQSRRRSPLAALAAKLGSRRWERNALPYDWTTDEAAARGFLGGPVDDPIWESDAADTAAPLAPIVPISGHDERVVAVENAVRNGRMRRLVGSSAAVVALGAALGAGFVSTGASADNVASMLPDTTGGTDTTATTATTSTTDTTVTSTDPTATTPPPVDPAAATSPPADPAPSTPPSDPAAPAPADPAPPVDTTAPADPTSTGSSTPTDTAPPPSTTDPAGDPDQSGDRSRSAVRPHPSGDRSGTKDRATSRAQHSHSAATPALGTPKKRVRGAQATTGGATTTQPGVPGTPAVSAPSTADVTPLLPTPAQLRFYVHASKVKPLPNLEMITHRMAVRLVVTAKRRHVGWTVLAAVARYESDFGARAGALAARRLSSGQFDRYGSGQSGDGTVSRGNPSDSLSALAGFLHAHGASAAPYKTNASTSALASYFGSQDTADRVAALAAFYGALGTGGIQNGLRWATPYLQKRVLHDRRVKIYQGGRNDIKNGRVDARVLMVVEYMANAMGSVRVSALVSGHRLFTTSGNVSAHMYGRAVDIAALGGTNILGHQGPHTVTERAVRLLLLLPKEVQPRQVISLMDLDGPTGNKGSFALPDHYNHIHVGY